MKTTISFGLALLFSCVSLGQNPVIVGDLLLCPNSSGTAVVTNNQIYDSYTWYWKYWFSSDPFVAIPGANSASFNYDWATYDQALLKVVVTLDGNTYESNTLQIDSYAWVGLTVGFEDSPNVSIDPDTGNVNLCQGTGFSLEVFQPYTNVQWYKDGQPIAGANAMQLDVTEAGSYYVVASPGFCPDSTSSTEGLPIVVQIDTTCGLGTGTSVKAAFSFYPNPVREVLTVASGDFPLDKLSVYDLAGQLVQEVKPGGIQSSMNLSSLAPGMYILEASGAHGIKRMKILKE